jgi:putative NIF3 family GTP cyclohydrolase 1 type 2
MPLRDLVACVEKAVCGPVKVFPGGPDTVGCAGIVTGGAGGEINKAAAEGVDTFITGEAPHWAAIAAEELRVNLLLAGHYATETFGVKALAALLSAKFGLPWQFIDHPTGL